MTVRAVKRCDELDDRCNDGCDEQASAACCVRRGVALLERRGPAVVEAGRRARLGRHDLVRLAGSVTVQQRDPLGVPAGWRLYNGQLTADPRSERLLAHHGLTVRVGSDGRHRRCDAELSGLVLAGRAVLDGQTLDHGRRMAVADMQPEGLLLREAVGLDHWATNVVAANHVQLDGRLLGGGADSRTCPTARSAAADVCAVSAVVVDTERRLLTTPDEHGVLIHGQLLPEDLAGAEGDLGRAWLAAVRRLASCEVLDGRMLSVTRDLLLGGQPRLVGLVVVGAEEEESRPGAVQLAGGAAAAGVQLQAAAAASRPVARARRGALDVAGAALRERRLGLRGLLRGRAA